MKIDKIMSFSYAHDVGGSLAKNYNRGTLNGILLFANSNSPDNLISVKIRNNEGVIVLANRLRFYEISHITNMKYGIGGHHANTWTQQQTINEEFEKTLTDGSQAETSVLTQIENINKQYNGVINPYYLPLGHITLGDDAYMEIELHGEKDASKTNTVECEAYAIHHGKEADHYLVYDASKDFDQTHQNVREVYYVTQASDGFANKDGSFDERDIQLDFDRDTILTDIKGVISATNVFTKHEVIPHDHMLLLYSTEEPLPTSLRTKITGYDASNEFLLFVKEYIPENVSDSTLENLRSLKDKVKELERENEEMAKRYRHAGRIQKSEELEEIEKIAEEGKKKEKGGK